MLKGGKENDDRGHNPISKKIKRKPNPNVQENEYEDQSCTMLTLFPTGRGGNPPPSQFLKMLQITLNSGS